MKRIIILIGILLASVSCESFLDMQPTSSANASQAIQTTADAGVALNGIMRSLTSSSLYGRNLLLYADAKGGDLTIFSAGRGLDGLYSFNHSATSNSYSGYWSSGFYVLMQVNNLIGNIERLEEAGGRILPQFHTNKATNKTTNRTDRRCIHHEAKTTEPQTES